MPDESPEPPESPDVRTIRQLVRLMHRYDLTAIDLVEGQTKIRLRRRVDEPVAPPGWRPDPGWTQPPTSPPTAAPIAPSPTPGPAAEPKVPSGVVIESPMVGTFYSSPAPDAPPFINIGSAVRPETTVCVIEAMKVFTDIPAGVAGTITEILVKNGQSVEFGQALFRVDPS